MLHIFPHWNLQGHEGDTIDVWVYSNCDEVELTVNGKRLSRQAMPRNGHLKWRAVYQPGRVVAKGYKNGRRLLTKTLETTQPARRLVLRTDRQQLCADGRDVAVVTIEVHDWKGRVVPDACPPLTLSLEGEGRILGVGNGDPSYLGADHPAEPDCRMFSLPAFNGLAQVIVQSTKQAGALRLQCTSNGLTAATINLTTEK